MNAEPLLPDSSLRQQLLAMIARLPEGSMALGDLLDQFGNDGMLLLTIFLTLVFLMLHYAIAREMYALLDHFLNIPPSALPLQLQMRTQAQAATLLPDSYLTGSTAFFHTYDARKRPHLRSVNSPSP